MSEFDHDPRVEELFGELVNHGVPPRRARIVALAAETDLTYKEIADELGVDSKGSVGNQIREYRGTRADAEWLAENAPEV